MQRVRRQRPGQRTVRLCDVTRGLPIATDFGAEPTLAACRKCGETVSALDASARPCGAAARVASQRRRSRLGVTKGLRGGRAPRTVLQLASGTMPPRAGFLAYSSQRLALWAPGNFTHGGDAEPRRRGLRSYPSARPAARPRHRTPPETTPWMERDASSMGAATRAGISSLANLMGMVNAERGRRETDVDSPAPPRPKSARCCRAHRRTPKGQSPPTTRQP